MGPRSAAEPRRLGRPPDADSAETRQRILDAARAAFAQHGYEVATNRSLAEAAGITSGALYHYFESKLDLYVAIYIDVTRYIGERFDEAIDGLDSFRDRVGAVLDASHALNRDDPSLAQFVAAVRIDRNRHAEVEEAVRNSGVDVAFFRGLIADGVASGEIAKADRAVVAAYLDVVLTGLTDAVSGDHRRHTEAIEGIKRSLLGRLLRK